MPVTAPLDLMRAGGLPRRGAARRVWVAWMVLQAGAAGAVDCTATIPAPLLGQQLAAAASLPCEGMKASYARSLDEQVALFRQLRPLYAGKAKAAAPGAKASDVQAAVARDYDAPLARLSSLAAAVRAAKLPGAAAAASAASAVAAAPPLADLLLSSKLQSKGLAERIAADPGHMTPAQVGVWCLLDHQRQFSSGLHGTLYAACLTKP